MRVIDALHQPWAIRPETLQTMFEVYERHASGATPNFEAIEAAIGKPLKNEPQPYQVINGVAVLNIVGVIAKRMDLFMRISGGASSERLQQELQAALNDPTAHSILLYIDSPGGDVDGTQTLANAIYNARDQKPVVTLADGVLASAAYWIGAAASSVYLATGTTLVGSIGVIARHKDVSEAEKRSGVKTTEVSAGKYKTISSQFGPLTAEGRQSIQQTLDSMYSVFINDIAKFRNQDPETVLSEMADGQIFVGQEAIDAGLADGFASVEELITHLNDARASGTDFGATAPRGGNMEHITAAQLEAAKAEAFERGKTEGHAAGKVEGKAEGVAIGKAEGISTGKAEGKAEGIIEGGNQERERIKAVEAALLPGHEKLIAELKADGKTSGAEAALKVITAEKEKKQRVGAQLREDAPSPITPSDPGTEQAAEPNAKEVAAKAQAHQRSELAAGRECTTEQAVRHVRKQLGLK
jgi:signal peptide peptidase SppA